MAATDDLSVEDYRRVIREAKQRAIQGLLASEPGHDGTFWYGYNMAIDALMRELGMMDEDGYEQE